MAYHHMPPVIAAGSFNLVKEPMLGGEVFLLAAQQRSVLLGALTITGASAATWVADVANAVVLSATPLDIVAVLDSAAPVGQTASAANIVVSVTGTDSASAAVTAAPGTFSKPTYAQNQSYAWPRCQGTDVVVAAGTQVKTISGVTVTCDAAMAGVRIKLYGVPPLSAFTQLYALGDRDFQPGVPRAVAYADGLVRSRYVRPGEIPETKLTFPAKVFNFAESGITLTSNSFTFMLETRRGRALVTERVLLVNGVATIKNGVPESDGAVMDQYETIVEDTIFLNAPTS